MSERKDQSGGFWRTLPGILSGVAAVVTAVTGLVVGLNAINSDGNGAKPETSGPVMTASSDSRRPVVADAIAGTWSGEAKKGRRTTFDVHVTIAKGCALKDTCGSISVSSGPCFGDLSFKSRAGDRYEFSVDHFSATSAEGCTPGAGEYLTQRDDDALLYTTGYDRSVRAVLRPPR